MQNITIFYCIFIYISIYTGINATHFEGGGITYKILNSTGTTVTILLTQTYIYDYTKIPCTNSMIANQSPKLLFDSSYRENSSKVNCTQYCNQSGGYVAPSVVSTCTDYSVSLGITVGQRSDVIKITDGTYFLVAYQSTSWRQLSLPLGSSNTNTGWSISCWIDLRKRSDGTYNNPPVSTIISPIYIPVGIQQVISIPTIDADNDQVRCRYASGYNECGIPCPPASLPNGTTLFSNCTLLITGTKVNDWYAVTIEIEDFINSASTTPLSTIPVQFLINVRAVSSCSKRPLLSGPVTETGGCLGIQVGQRYVIQLTAENFCPNTTTITDIATLSFPVIVKSPIVKNSSTIWSISVTWVPTNASIGSQVLCAVAIDSANVQSNQYCMTFTVAQETVPTCPGEVVQTTQVTTTKTTVTSQITSTIVTTTVTSLASTMITIPSTIQSTLLQTTSSVLTTSQSTLITSVLESSLLLSTWESTTSVTTTNQPTQMDTYTSLISTMQSTSSSTTTQSTSMSSFSEDSSILPTWTDTISTILSNEPTLQQITETSSISTIQSTSSSSTVPDTSDSTLSESNSTVSSQADETNAALTSVTDLQETTYISLTSITQSIVSTFHSSLNTNSTNYPTVTVTNLIETSKNVISSTTSTVSNTERLQQSSNANQNNATTKANAVSSSSDSNSSWPWLAIILGVLALALIGLCICCLFWYCCPRFCLCCPPKRRKRATRSSSVDVPHIVHNPTANDHYPDDDNMFLANRPSSVASARSANDILLDGLKNENEKKPIPHYATPLNRSARVAPSSASSVSQSICSTTSSLSPTAYLFGNRQASKLSQ